MKDKRIYLVKSYYMWFDCIELMEDDIIERHFKTCSDRYPVPVGFDEFEDWYSGVYRYNKPKVGVTISGDFISYSNNSAYVILEAESIYEAIDKAIKIFKTPLKIF